MKKVLALLASDESKLSKKIASIQPSQFLGDFPPLKPLPPPKPEPKRGRWSGKIIQPKPAVVLKKPPRKDCKRASLPPTHKSPFAFENADLPEAQSRFDAIVSRFTHLPILRVCNVVLKSFSAISPLPTSVSFLKHMMLVAPSFVPDHTTYHILLSHSCRTRDYTLSHAYYILKLMDAGGCPPQLSTLNVAVWSLAKSKRIDDAVDFVKEFSLKHNIVPDIRVYNFVLEHLCKSRCVSTVQNYILEMQKIFKIEPDYISFQVMIYNICSTSSDRLNLREIGKLFGVLVDCGFKLDTTVYNALMRGCCKMNEFHQVSLFFENMRDKGIEPDVSSYNILISGLSNVGRVEDGKKFMDLMTDKGYYPDEDAYTSLVTAFCQRRDPLPALALMNGMRKKGCYPYECTYNVLLHGLCKFRFLERGVELYGVMKSAGVKLRYPSYSVLVRKLCRNGRVDLAYEVLDYAIESKSLADITSHYMFQKKDVAAYMILEITLKWLERDRERGIAK